MSAGSTGTTDKANHDAKLLHLVPRAPIEVSLPPFERVQKFLVNVRLGKYKPFASDLLGEATTTLTSATVSPPSVTFTLTVIPALCNPLGHLHGGASATLFDNITSCAVAPIAKPGFWEWAGVSRSLTCTYFRPVSVGEKITVYAEVLHAGRNMMTIKGELRDSKGRLCVTCEHLKVSIEPEVKGGGKGKL